MMRFPILFKLLTVMLVLTIVPLGILGYSALQDEKTLGLNAAKDARLMGIEAANSSKAALMNLGEQLIQQKANDHAKQMKIYIADHPALTVQALQNDPVFQDIAVQSVGKRGYVSVIDSSSLIYRFHPDPKYVNYDTHNDSVIQPSFWSILPLIGGGNETGGYYRWKEEDGSISDRYMYVVTLNQTTADGVKLASVVTVNTDEFSQPATQIKEKITTSVTATIMGIIAATESMSTQNTILTLTILSIIIVIIICFIMAASITRPIKKLTEIADKVSMGDLQTTIDVHTNDEIDDLAESFRRMINAFKMMVSMQESPEEE
ncbi:MAG TPA: HAMP domain-containing protein [Methanospirillum sp.]|nr:HAMP domain-containing protein [Methanospirillum sp.]